MKNGWKYRQQNGDRFWRLGLSKGDDKAFENQRIHCHVHTVDQTCSLLALYDAWMYVDSLAHKMYNRDYHLLCSLIATER